MSKERLVYEPPVSMDLSEAGVRGQKNDPSPYGICGPGGQPYTQCSNGPSISGGSCTPGQSVDTYPQCKLGSSAIVGCSQGSVA